MGPHKQPGGIWRLKLVPQLGKGNVFLLFLSLFGATLLAEFGGMCAVGAAVGRSGPHGDPF